jgi:chemotaxis protein methyltransferase CheR
MISAVSEALLIRLSELIAAQMGLNFPKDRHRDLERGVASAARDFGFDDVESCMQWLVSSILTENQIEVLASHLTIGETYLFRDRKFFEIFEGRILPELVRLRRPERRLRIWSAGCSTGEEPYSIAISLNRVIPDLGDWDVTILATDINNNSLQTASRGTYGEWSFRETPEWIRYKYFKDAQEDRHELRRRIRKMVTFSYHNLAADVYPSIMNNTNAMDIIVCRNVLIYFTAEQRYRVVQQLCHSLVDGGWLVVGPCEIAQVSFPQLSMVRFPEVILYRKEKYGTRPAEDFRTGFPSLTPQTGFAPKLEFQAKVSLPVQEEAPEAVPDQAPDADIEEEQLSNPYQEALGLYDQGRYAEAAEKLVGVISDDGCGNDEKAITLLAQAYVTQGRMVDALEWCEKAITAEKLNPNLHYLRATILQERGQIKEAVASLKRALYLDQSFVLAHFVLGHFTRQQGKLRESNKHFENALSFLGTQPPGEVLPGSGGITAGELTDIIQSVIHGGNIEWTSKV